MTDRQIVNESLLLEESGLIAHPVSYSQIDSERYPITAKALQKCGYLETKYWWRHLETNGRGVMTLWVIEKQDAEILVEYWNRIGGDKWEYSIERDGHRFEVIDKFRQVYADVVLHPDAPLDELKTAFRVRELTWTGKRMSLVEAAKLYAILGCYHAFEPDMLAKLHVKFPDRGIEVTPGRENSAISLHPGVVVRLHVPIESRRREIRKFVEKNFMADEVNWETADTLRIWWD